MTHSNIRTIEKVHIDWEPVQRRIIELWLSPSLKLKDVIRIVQEETGFIASEKQYRYQLEAWGIKKNMMATELNYIDSICKKRDAEGKQTRVKRYGVRIQKEEIDKRLSRRFHSTMDNKLREVKDKRHVYLTPETEAIEFDLEIGTPTTLNSNSSPPQPKFREPLRTLSSTRVFSDRQNVKRFEPAVSYKPADDGMDVLNLDITPPQSRSASPAPESINTYRPSKKTRAAPLDPQQAACGWPSNQYLVDSDGLLQAFDLLQPTCRGVPLSDYKRFISCTASLVADSSYALDFYNDWTGLEPNSISDGERLSSSLISCRITFRLAQCETFDIIQGVFESLEYARFSPTGRKQKDHIEIDLRLCLVPKRYRKFLQSWNEIAITKEGSLDPPTFYCGEVRVLRKGSMGPSVPPLKLASLIYESSLEYDKAKIYDAYSQNIDVFAPVDTLLTNHVHPTESHEDLAKFLCECFGGDLHPDFSARGRNAVLRLAIRCRSQYSLWLAGELTQSFPRLDFTTMLEALYYGMPRNGHSGHHAFSFILLRYLGKDGPPSYEAASLFLICVFLGREDLAMSVFAPFIDPEEVLLFGENYIEVAYRYRHKQTSQTSESRRKLVGNKA